MALSNNKIISFKIFVLHSLKKISGSLLFVFVFAVASAQPIRFSIATDLGLQRSFKKEQQYWAGGHTIQAQFHFNPKDGAYVWISYYTNGKFSNNVTAIAKSAATLPQQINYVNNAVMRFKQIYIAWIR